MNTVLNRCPRCWCTRITGRVAPLHGSPVGCTPQSVVRACVEHNFSPCKILPTLFMPRAQYVHPLVFTSCGHTPIFCTGASTERFHNTLLKFFISVLRQKFMKRNIALFAMFFIACLWVGSAANVNGSACATPKICVDEANIHTKNFTTGRVQL